MNIDFASRIGAKNEKRDTVEVGPDGPGQSDSTCQQRYVAIATYGHKNGLALRLW